MNDESLDAVKARVSKINYLWTVIISEFEFQDNLTRRAKAKPLYAKAILKGFNRPRLKVKALAKFTEVPESRIYQQLKGDKDYCTHRGSVWRRDSLGKPILITREDVFLVATGSKWGGGAEKALAIMATLNAGKGENENQLPWEDG